MAENVAEILTGAGVVAVALGFLVYAGDGVGFDARTDTYPLSASFRSVEGITVGTDVRLAGVKIGTVTELALNSTTFFADAVLNLREGVVIPSDSTAVVASEGLLGGAFVEILPGGSPDDLSAGDEIEDTQGSVSVIALLMKFVGAASGGDSGTSSP